MRRRKFLNILPLTMIIVSWMIVVLNWLIKHMVNEKRMALEKGFENCSSFWVKHLKLMFTFVHFYTFFGDRSLVCVKCILLNLSCVFCKEFEFCTLGGSIIFSMRTHQSILTSSSLFDFYAMWFFLNIL